MKTAMQELIDDIQQAFQGQWGVYLNSEKFAPYLEKEKEQIMDARNDGIVSNIKGYCISNEEYYNQTYNQNK
jgi:hypothetical protein